ncbi:MAG: xanthine dehydrogenase family protein molybdopterin-binding subunit [Candidatus Palauibacterales bacterium]|nr:xanthine dehydrogenase family protein molybdopterin-binding subunit [Candidatus Palauibacterales bacterium]
MRHSSAGPTRREFLKTSAVATGGLVIAFHVPGAKRLAIAGMAPADTFAPNAFLRIGTDDTITVLLAHSEMGQGIWTSLPMLIAEELECDWGQIRVEHAPAAPAYAHTAFGIQATGGSTTTWSEFDRYRQAGALARAMLVAAAAEKFGVSPSECRALNGVVVAGDKRATFGELAKAAAALEAPGSVPLKDPEDWTVIGTPRKRLDTPEKITGQAQFGIDVQFDGLLTAVVAHAPTFGGTVRSFDATEALAVPGVRQVVQVPSGVAVVADHFWAATTGRNALKVEWAPGPAAGVDTDALRAEYLELAGTPGATADETGNVAEALATASKTIEGQFSVPYLAHAPMEPLNCTVRIGPDGCEIWTGTQFQTVDQGAAAAILGLAPEQVTLHTTFLGGGFGRRANPANDFVAEAVHVAKAAGAPVKTVWTRENDTRGGYYRPAFVHRARLGLGADGGIIAWDHVAVGQSIVTGTLFEGMIGENGIDPNSVEGLIDSPYLTGVPNRRIGLHTPAPGVPVLWWRSVGHTHTAFVVESMVDEAAHAAGRDPVDYRRTLLADHPRQLGVLELAAEKAKWGSPLPAGQARGVAIHESFGSFVAEVAEVSVEDDRIRVHRVVCAVDCGVAVNPATIAVQLQGAVAFGLSAALHSSISLKEGRVQESNFHDYQVLRLSEMPAVETYIVPSKAPPGGIGEPGTPPIAPAVANAVFALTGQRLRDLPLKLTLQG